MPVARVISVEGSVEVIFAEPEVQTASTPARNAPLCPGDTIRTGQDGIVSIEYLIREGGAKLSPDAALQFLEPSDEGRSVIDLLEGILYFFSRDPAPLDVTTPFVTAGVEGTEFVVEVQQDRTVVTVFEGLVRMANPLGTLLLAQNQSGEAIMGQAPQLRIVVRPRDAVQWAIYYPPGSTAFIDTSDDGSPLDQALVESVAALRAGDRTQAFDRLEEIPEGDRNERFYVYRAGLRLAAGLVDAARADLDQALIIAPGNGEAHGLRAIIAVAQNDLVGALASGEEAVALSQNSSSARVALSYAQQANSDLEGARDSLLQAVEIEPNDSMAWARLAEISLSLGYLDRALEAAETANLRGPELARTNSVLGFARLSQIRLTEAVAAFERAIELDSESSLARLGLGLTRIRDGNLEEGRGEIEAAVVLDPNNPIIRSYLGKAFFEERRDALAAEELEIAKELDPNDPTPYFYDAIRKQMANRPVEAVGDLHRSIELNDGRAVYRSRLLLDEDTAARSASLGRIYRDLGFEQLALSEAWHSVNLDPASYSAHRFMADSYSALTRHEAARVSDLLQSQLLQPINLTPVQPQLAETDLFILSGAGPSDIAFSEFTPVFTRDGLAVQANGIAGENDTLGNDLVVSGIHKRLSFSLGQFHYETDGFSENNDQDRDIYNAFLQGAVSQKTSLQGEFRHSDLQSGDLTRTFDPHGFSDTIRNNERTNSARLGVHHVFAPGQDLIASVVYNNRRVETLELGGRSNSTQEATASSPRSNTSHRQNECSGS